MNLAKALGLFLAVLFYANFLQAQSIFINEFMASNGETIADENGEFDDWVEFYNAGPTAFDLGGKYVTDDLTEPTQWQIPTTNPSLTTIPPGGYLIVWFDGDTEQGELHADPKLGGGGEQIGLYDSDGITPIDFLTYGQQTEDISEGRFPDGSATFENFSPATPGAANDNVVLEVTEPPVASPQGGPYTSTTSVTITSATSEATIYYTTDGSDPTESSTLYTGPITVSETTVIRARAFLAGNEDSEITTNSYFINTNSTFPIVSFSGDPDKFFGADNGMFVKINEDIEHPINVEFYEVDGTQGFNQVAEVELHGNESVNNSQKSLAIKAKGSLGSSTIDYAVFPDEPLNEYRSLILRNSGQDWRYTMFRDAMESSLIRDVSDLDVDIEYHNIDDQAYRPAIAYVNGEYWGFYNIRERYDWRYLKAHYDLDDDEVDLIDNLDDAKEGDYVEWNRLDSILESKSFTDAAGLAELDALVDLDNFRDYILINAFVDNVDWPGTNNRRWRERVPDGKWRWMLKDLDFSYGLLEINGGFNTGNFNHNILDDLLNNTNFPTYSWSTLLFRKLMENPVWLADYVNRSADQLNVLYNKERLLQRIDDFQAVYQPEVPAQLQRWNNIWTWDNDIDVLRTFANGRTDAMRNHYVTSLSEVTGTSEVTLTASPANGGKVRINTITTDQNNYPWTGTYFDGIEVPIEAIPNPGFFFVGWSSNVSGVGPSTTVTLSDDITITAIFAPDGGGPIDQTISFPSIADKSTSSPPFTINATASSGLPVSFSIVSGPATISGNTITLNGTEGIVVVSASQAGNAQFNPAPNVTQSFEVMDSPLQDQTINFSSISDKFVSSLPFILNATATSGLPVSYNIVSGPASVSGNTVTLNGTLGTVVISASQAGNAQFNPAPTINQTFQVIMDPPNGAYCESEGSSPWQEYIANVNLGTINNNSGKEKYEDFTALSTNLEKGQSYPIALTPGFSWAHYDEVFSVWIDWNGDFDFDDVGEQVFSSLFPAGQNGSAPNPVTGTITVPNSAINGTTRMRVTMQRDQATGPCGFFTLGETEDYSIVVSGGGGPTLNISCPSAIDLTVPFGSGGTTVTWADPTVNGTCPTGVNAPVQTAGAASGTFFNVGSYIIEYTVSDNCGNTTTCSFTIDITEDVATTLSLTCPAAIDLSVPFGSGGTTVTWADPTVNSDCPTGVNAPFQSAGAASGTFFSIGSYIIEYTVTDNCGNTTTCSFTIDITEDASTTLSITCPAAIDLSVPFGSGGTTVTWADPTVTSDCPTGVNAPFQSAGAASGTFFNIGSYIIEYTVTDNCGNTTTCSFTIDITEDASTTLSITCPAAIDLSVPFGSGGTTVTWADPIVTSDCPTGVNAPFQSAGAASGTFFNIGSYIIEYTVTDNCGNTTTCSFTIDITEDAQGSMLEIICPSNIALTVPVGSGGTAVTWALPTTNSDCPSGGITLVQTGGPSNGSFFGLGSYVIEYTSADNCNNIEMCTFSVTISEETNNGVYCESEGNSPWNEYIGNVNFGAINNSSGKDKYEDFTSQSTTVAKGGTYPVILTPSFSYIQWDEYFTVWIDWNQDFDFDDAGEKVVMEIYPDAGPGATVVPVNSTINVPIDAVTGTTRMRVTMQREAEAPVCGNFEFGETEDYSVTVMGESMTGLTLSCPQPISVTVPVGATGTTVDWVMPTANTDCPTGIPTILQTGGQASGSFFNIGSYIIEYTSADDCGNNATCSFVVNVIEGGSATYCDSKGNSPWNEYIGNVTLGSIDNSSGKDQYGDFTNLSTALIIGSDNQITLTPAFSYIQWDEVFSVWIDYNGNGSFDDAGELVLSSTYAEQAPGSTPIPVVGNFTVPNAAQALTTLMRVSMKRDIAATSCETFDLGEVEDYTVQLVNAASANRSNNYLNFVAFGEGRGVELQWLTNTIAQSENFTIEHSPNGVDFQLWKQVNEFDNKNQDAYFEEVDTNPLIGDNYYRLKQVFRDGRVDYSPIELVQFGIDLKGLSIFPNPAQEVLNVQVGELFGEPGTIQLFDTYGRLQKDLQIVQINAPIISIPLTDVPNGLYYLKILGKDKKAINKKVIVKRLY